jgi:lipoyl(octanoyl) transferase
MVAYPILRVDRRPGGLRLFFFDLEESVIRTLARFGLDSGRMHGRPGVWIKGRKICSTGIAVKRWITSHGLSLNVARDLALFSLVSPCGLPGVRATSLHRELRSAAIGMEKVKEVFAEEFCALFWPELRRGTSEDCHAQA